MNKESARELLKEHKKTQKNERINNQIVNISDAETVGYASDISDAETIQHTKPYKNKSRLNNQYRQKAKKKAIKTTKVVRQPSPEVEITRVIPKITPNADYRKRANEVIFKGKTFAHLKTRKKIKERRLARGNSAAVKADFAIDPEDYIDKLLVFDLKTTSEDEVFDWLVTNMTVDNDIYYIEHEECSNVF